jgi:hypothetical protein
MPIPSPSLFPLLKANVYQVLTIINDEIMEVLLGGQFTIQFDSDEEDIDFSYVFFSVPPPTILRAHHFAPIPST